MPVRGHRVLIIFVIQFLSLLIPATFAARVDSAAPYFAFDRKVAANCERRFARVDRLATLERFFPDTAPAFRRAFVWMKVGEGSTGLLLGYPRRMTNAPPFFVLVPVNAPRDQPTLVINIDMNHALVANAFRHAIRRLEGVMFSLPHFGGVVENGVRYPARSEDLLFFDRPGTRAVSVDQGLRLAAQMAARLPIRPPALRPVRDL